jgi:osmoprotectant transport system substrate-binding protein
MVRALSIAVVTSTCLLLSSGCSTSSKDGAIRVASKNFTEQVLLGEIIAQHLGHRLQKPIERRLNLGGTLLAHQALRSGEIDLYPEYTGTAMGAVLKLPLSSDASATLARVRSEYRTWEAEWFDPLGIDNTFAMVVQGSRARKDKLESLSDAAASPTGWLLGAGYEFEQRADGLPSLDKTYQLRWTARPKSMDLGLLYKALEQNQVTMIAANATDGLLSKADLKVLADDKKAFPSYQVCIVARQAALSKTPELRAALHELSGKFTNAAMQQMNYQVDVDHRPVVEVAREFLQKSGLK